MNHTFKSVLPLVLTLSSSLAWAAPIAIIDSGTDLKHTALVDHAWTNPGGIPGDDFKDDTHGWNFAESNNQIIDYSYMGKFSSDTTKFFEIQLKVLNGTATDEDKKWFDEKHKDEKFLGELETFANFVHGTHVAGIASKGAPKAEIMAAKIIPTEVKKPPAAIEGYLRDLSRAGYTPFTLSPSDNPTDPGSGGGGFFQDLLFKGALWFLAGQQSSTLEPVGKYVGTLGMRVANCSFGTGTTQAKMVVSMLAKTLLKRDLSDEEATKYAVYFLGQILEKGKGFVTSAGNTLFVIAAGNDGSDNDKFPDYPGNLKLENTITVAATRDYDRLASFSNFGATTVDIAAPGVGIRSSIPTPAENETLVVSGTSQASPYIANLAGKVIDANPTLSVSDVKKILMQTVDKKAFLEGKVASGGIANEERAVRAAQLSVHQTVDQSIQKARTEVADFVSPSARMRARGMTSAVDTGYDGEPFALPSLFQTVN